MKGLYRWTIVFDVGDGTETVKVTGPSFDGAVLTARVILAGRGMEALGVASVTRGVKLEVRERHG